MGHKRNKAVPHNHYTKEWHDHVRTWFDQPARATRRSATRNKKAAQIFPRPIESLKPVIHPAGIRYNMKVRLGRGFTIEELKQAGIGRQFAQTIGIAVDFRRKNKSEKSLKVNVQRLKEYKSKLVLFPKKIKSKKIKAGEATAEQTSQAQQLKGIILPPKEQKVKLEVVSLADLPKQKESTYATLRRVRSFAKHVGTREKRAKEKAEKAATESTKKPAAE